MPPPADAPKPSEQQLQCDMLYEYPAANDRLLCYVRRFEAKNGKRKLFFPLTYGVLNGKRGWHARRPRLRGPSTASTGCRSGTGCDRDPGRRREGCRCRTTAVPPHVAMSWMGGAAAEAAPICRRLEGHNVILWPDADKRAAM